MNRGNLNRMLLGQRMEIRFEATHEGMKFFNVSRADDKTLFTGTLDQCQRFIDVYREKVLKQTG